MSGRPRHYLYVFSFLMILFSCLFTGSAGWLIDNLSTFQSGILGVGHMVTGILIGLWIKSVAVDRYIDNILYKRPTPPANREEVKRFIDFYTYKDGAPIIIIFCCVAIALSCFYGYNTIMIVAAYCPAQHATHHIESENGEVDINSPKDGTITMLLYYDHTVPGEYYPRSSMLQLKYNTTNKEVIRRAESTDPNRYREWYSSHQIFTPKKQSELDESEEAATGGANENTFCINRKDTLFSFLDNEVTHELALNQKAREEAKTIQFKTFNTFKGNGIRPTNEDENAILLDMMIRFMCRNEFAFIIIIITMLSLWDTLMIAIIGYNIYLLRVAVPE